MATPNLLWQLRGLAGTTTECTLHQTTTGEFEIRISRASSVLFGERYASEAEARGRARAYFDSLREKGWRTAA